MYLKADYVYHIVWGLTAYRNSYSVLMHEHMYTYRQFGHKVLALLVKK